MGNKYILTKDLTKYHPSLKTGVVGENIGVYGKWSRNSDAFTGIRFKGITTLDVAFSSLTRITEEEYAIRLEQQLSTSKTSNPFEEYKEATDIVLRLGVRGGFQSLSFRYNAPAGYGKNISIGFRKEGYAILDYFRTLGKPIREEKERRTFY